MSDCDRILEALRNAPRGTLTNNQLSQMLWPGLACKALHSRMAELRGRGYAISDAKYVRCGVYSYTLSESQSPSGQSTPPVSQANRAGRHTNDTEGRSETAPKLFDVEPVKPEPIAYGDPRSDEAA